MAVVIQMTVVDAADGLVTAEVPGEAQGVTFAPGPEMRCRPGDLVTVRVETSADRRVA